MMKMKNFFSVVTVLLVMFFVSACSTDDEILERVPQSDEESARAAATAVAPKWDSGFPKTPFGAVSVDLRFKTDVNSKVYWVASTAELSLTKEALKAEAVKSTISTIKFKGVSTVTGGKEKLEKPTGFAQNTKYYVYMIAESATGAILQSSIKSSVFTTFQRQQQKEYQSSAENRKVLYLLYKPEEALKYPTKKFPIIFFLGGNGEVAAQGKINLARNGSLAEHINRGNDVPLIVMSIQHIRTNWNIDMINEGVTHAFATNAVDTKKVYMTGMSGGGFATWNYAVAYASRLTAIVPISGGGNNGKACTLNNVQVYAFHNASDATVSTANSVNMVNAVNNCAPKEKAKLLLFPDKGHNCWRRVYNKDHKEWSKSPTTERVDIYAWMLTKSK